MTDSDEINAARERLSTLATDFWRALEEQGHKPANRISDKARALIKDWEARGRACELMLPLLTHETEAVRFWAADWLLNRGTKEEESIAVLRDVAKNPKGFLGITARALLIKRGALS